MTKARPGNMAASVRQRLLNKVMLGIANSRMKDFYDLWMLAGQFKFGGPVLCTAIRATFARRQTALPEQPPLALTTEFTEDSRKRTQWQAFLGKNKLDAEGLTLPEIAGRLRAFLMPPTEALVHGTDFEMDWLPHGPWRSTTGT